MKLCCCFCGKEIEAFPRYVLTIRKDSDSSADEAPEQQLYCHEECLKIRLHDANWLYLTHL